MLGNDSSNRFLLQTTDQMKNQQNNKIENRNHTQMQWQNTFSIEREEIWIFWKCWLHPDKKLCECLKAIWFVSAVCHLGGFENKIHYGKKKQNSMASLIKILMQQLKHLKSGQVRRAERKVQFVIVDSFVGRIPMIYCGEKSESNSML